MKEQPDLELNEDGEWIDPEQSERDDWYEDTDLGESNDDWGEDSYGGYEPEVVEEYHIP